jgi:hypothetical protein
MGAGGLAFTTFRASFALSGYPSYSFVTARGRGFDSFIITLSKINNS